MSPMPTARWRTPHHVAGDVGFSGTATHTETNVGKKPFEVLVVDLKG